MSDDSTTPEPSQPATPEPDAVSAATVFDYLIYGLSLPERALRSSSSAVGGALRESAALLVPQAFRSSQSYSVFVQQMLDFLAEDVGGVESKPAPGKGVGTDVEQFVARKTIGSFVDFAGVATLHVSPLTILAILGDVAYGSHSYLKELSDELKREGIIDQNTTIDRAADLLDAVGDASSGAAEVFDMPPVSVEGMRETIQQTTTAVARVNPVDLIPQSEIERLWQEMHEIARKEQVSLFEVSSAMSMYALNRMDTASRGALSTIRVAGNMFDKHILDHYSNGVAEIRKQGIYGMLAETSRPYIEAVWKNFALERATITEELVTGRLIGKAWTGLRYWLTAKADESGAAGGKADCNGVGPGG